MMNRRTALAGLAATGAMAPLAADANAGAAEELRRHTADLQKAVATGRADEWRRLVHPAFVVTDESGRLSNKAELVAGLKPLGSRISASLALEAFEARIFGDVAVTTYVSDEHERFFGHSLHCQYRTTDTWKREREGWRLIASQVLALRTDPPPVPIRGELLRDMAGTYSLAPDKILVISASNGGLWLNEAKRPVRELRAEANEVFFVVGQPRYRYIVERGSAGQISALIQRREAWDLRWAREA